MLLPAKMPATLEPTSSTTSCLKAAQDGWKEWKKGNIVVCEFSCKITKKAQNNQQQKQQ
jgi:hypothetical protein